MSGEGSKSKMTPSLLASCKAEYAAGASLKSLSRKYEVPYSSLQYHASKDGWKQDAELAIQRRVADKLAGISLHDDDIKREAAIEAAADKLVAVKMQHRDQWEEVGKMRAEALREPDENKAFYLLKKTKITAELTEILQRGQSRALGLDVRPSAAKPAAEGPSVFVSIDRV